MCVFCSREYCVCTTPVQYTNIERSLNCIPDPVCECIDIAFSCSLNIIYMALCTSHTSHLCGNIQLPGWSRANCLQVYCRGAFFSSIAVFFFYLNGEWLCIPISNHTDSHLCIIHLLMMYNSPGTK